MMMHLHDTISKTDTEEWVHEISCT
jgi:hypothetical protein